MLIDGITLSEEVNLPDSNKKRIYNLSSQTLEVQYIYMDKNKKSYYLPDITDNINEGDIIFNEYDNQMYIKGQHANYSLFDKHPEFDTQYQPLCHKGIKHIDVIQSSVNKILDEDLEEYEAPYKINLIKPFKRPKMQHRTRDLLAKHRKEVDYYLGYQREKIKIKDNIEKSLKNINDKNPLNKTKEQKELAVQKLNELRAKKWSLQKTFDKIGQYYSDNDDIISRCASISITLYLLFTFPYVVLSKIGGFNLDILFYIFTFIAGGLALVPIFVLTTIGFYKAFWKFPKSLFKKSDEEKND